LTFHAFHRRTGKEWIAIKGRINSPAKEKSLKKGRRKYQGPGENTTPYGAQKGKFLTPGLKATLQRIHVGKSLKKKENRWIKKVSRKGKKGKRAGRMGPYAKEVMAGKRDEKKNRPKE